MTNYKPEKYLLKTYSYQNYSWQNYQKTQISVICTDNIEEAREDNGSSKFINVNSLDMKGKTLDEYLEFISQPEDADNIQKYTKDVEQLFNCFKDLYKQCQGLFGASESRYHGFVYGALVLNFKQIFDGCIC
ncbi:hypothetical protein [Orientia tsutsugamushi]|uniref:hypothetical protein n=1 Tax=Orientia tsutsugamushi TaxID=784 RepID=UPI00123A2EFF|nr:hypothetical protein [Orientia tsutsugamushi]QES96761.1 hypothetical protein F0363_10530 [Orientia tsutsugamushi]